MTGHSGMSRLKEPRLKQTRWPGELHMRLKTFSEDEGRSMDEVIRTAVDEYLVLRGYNPAPEQQ